MRWLVEVAPIGSKETQNYCVEADSWQKALQSARKLRGDSAPMSGFSIELMNEGCKAVDPASRLRYEVRRTTDDTPLTPGGEAASPPSSTRSRPPRPKSGKSKAPPAVAPKVEASAPEPQAATPAKTPSRPVSSPPAAIVVPPILIKREQNPTPEAPLTYREYAFQISHGASEDGAEHVLRAQLARIQGELVLAPPGKLVNLAAFDEPFQGRPRVLPIATLSWKDWREDASVTFPRRDRAAAPISEQRPTNGASAAAPPAAPPVASQPAPAPTAAPPTPQVAVAPPAPASKPPKPAKPSKLPTAASAPAPAPPLTQSGTQQRAAPPKPARVAGEELISVLFESMHDLHFLRDAIDASDFCLSLAGDKLPSRASLVHLYDIDRREFVLVCARGAVADALLLQRYPESEPALSAAMRKRRGMVLSAADAVVTQSAVFQSVGGAQSSAIAPVMQAGRFLGAITLIDPTEGGPFSELDANALSYMAEQLAEFVGARGVVVDPERVKEAKASGAR